MSVEKIEVEGYRVLTDSPCPEWANVFLREWTRTRHDGIAYGGEIAIHGSFGTYAYTWTHCGSRFKHFLLELDFDYFMAKASPKYKEFDFEGSLKNIRHAVLEHRRRGDIDEATAAAIWAGLREIDAEGSRGLDGFVGDLYGIDELRRVTQEPYEYARERPRADAVGFWRELWPLFTAKLREELAAQSTEATA